MTQRETPVGPLIGHIQTDTFCETCGYNLHTQAVMRDERLGILVCRCPECGRFAAAGKSTARQVWLNRLGIGLLLVWIGFLLGVFVLCSLFLGLACHGQMMNDVQAARLSSPTPQNRYVSWHYIVRKPPGSAQELSRQRTQAVTMACVVAMLGLFTGGFAAVCLWHVRGWRRLVALLPPLVGFAFAVLRPVNDQMMDEIRDWALTRMSWGLAGECVAVLAGLWIGRPVARAVLRILLPPKLLQHLSFLWTTDGKQLKM